MVGGTGVKAVDAAASYWIRWRCISSRLYPSARLRMGTCCVKHLEGSGRAVMYVVCHSAAKFCQRSRRTTSAAEPFVTTFVSRETHILQAGLNKWRTDITPSSQMNLYVVTTPCWAAVHHLDAT